MKLTLRKAAKLRSKIDDMMSDLRFKVHDTGFTINANDPDILIEVNKASNEIGLRVAKFAMLAVVRTGLRAKIGNVNSQSGISDLLATLHQLREMLGVVTQLRQAEPRLGDAQIEARVEAMKNRSATAGGREEMRISLVTAAYQETLRTEEGPLRKNIDEVADEVERLNNVTELTLDDEWVTILTSLDLL